MSDFVWINAYYGADDNASGVLGLAGNQYSYNFVYYLYYNGVIAENTFAMGLRSYNDYAGSFMDVGFADTNAMATGTVAYVDVSAGYGYWASTLSGIRFRLQTGYDISLDQSMSSVQEFNLGLYADVSAITSTNQGCINLPYSISYFA